MSDELDPVQTFGGARPQGAQERPATSPAAGAPATPPAASFDDDGDLDPVERDTPLDTVLAELAAPPEGQTFLRSIPIPNRPGFTLVVNIDFPHEELKAWRKRCTTRPEKVTPHGTKPAVIDELRLAATIIAARTVEIRKHGSRVIAGDEPAAFTNPAFLAQLQADRAINAVTQIFASDGHVLRAGGKIIDEAGYGEDLTVEDDEDDFEDPTIPRSRDFSA